MHFSVPFSLLHLHITIFMLAFVRRYSDSGCSFSFPCFLFQQTSSKCLTILDSRTPQIQGGGTVRWSNGCLLLITGFMFSAYWL
ncbi:hypothetical protein BO94DRAFT_56113 [Aspergillus sclerotioniger CBS 115572]|uniref:Uncharacterized protein n=1 Tax=Aspergillus sclerotioniger CBS 115572 TaxID=1450535 RepID=A0A317WN49_9EURO|nr:hypothetical protein BO94DRAFT_56113 [Aspergillus sclerotioniger CBS 115572]PWY87849.1 hypothetical protein BO94DRAFT_56113 [Aspergillus sclerotioniger CBS 115572]